MWFFSRKSGFTKFGGFGAFSVFFARKLTKRQNLGNFWGGVGGPEMGQMAVKQEKAHNKKTRVYTTKNKDFFLPDRRIFSYRTAKVLVRFFCPPGNRAKWQISVPYRGRTRPDEKHSKMQGNTRRERKGNPTTKQEKEGRERRTGFPNRGVPQFFGKKVLIVSPTPRFGSFS